MKCDKHIRFEVTGCPCCLEEERDRLRSGLEKWLNMSDSQMRLCSGEMTAQEIRTVRAVLSSILKGCGES